MSNACRPPRLRLLLSACLYLCAVMMLCVALLPTGGQAKAQGLNLDLQTPALSWLASGAQAPAATSGGTAEAPPGDTAQADLPMDSSEPLPSVPTNRWPIIQVQRPAEPRRHDLPHPLIDTPQRPPRA